MKNRLRGLLPLLLISVLVFSACGGDDPVPRTAVAVTMDGWEVSVVPNVAPAGEVAFRVTNRMAEAHEFVIVKNDLPPAQLPIAGGRVAEESVYITERMPQVGPGATSELELDLTPGKYVLICNLPGHYEEGMYASFLVEP